MRWRIVDPENKREAAEREAVLRRIDAWWKIFAAKTGDITALFSRKAEWDLPAWMEEHFSQIHTDVCWEFGPAMQGEGHRLAMTPESCHHLRPLVRTIRKRAPASEGWEFYEYRVPESLESMKHAVDGRVGCDASDFKVKVSRGECHRIDLEFTSPSIAAKDEQTGLHAAFIATETLLGEQILNEWIGGIDFKPGKASGIKSLFVGGGGGKEGQHLLGLDRLKDTVDALIGSIVEQNPPQPHYERISVDGDGAEWTLWELKPDEAEDYARQADLFVGKSVNVPMWTAAHTDAYFSSKRFSQCGETFCYVKIDGSEGLGEGGFADKSEIEDALDAALRPEKLGCQIGGGMGLRYAYVDLALTDVMKAIGAIRKCLRAGKVPKRSWLLFFDSDWAAEWVGVYGDTPAPPLGEIE